MLKALLSTLLLTAPSSAAADASRPLTKSYLIGGWALAGSYTCDDNIAFMVFRPDGRWQFDDASGGYKVSGNTIVYSDGEVQRIQIVDDRHYRTSVEGKPVTMIRCPINWDNVSLGGKRGI